MRRRIGRRHFAVLLAVCALGLLPLLAGAGTGPSSPLRPSATAESPSEGSAGGELNERDRWFYDQRAYPGKAIPKGAYAKARTEQQALRASQRKRAGIDAPTPTQLSWSELGPHSITSYASNYFTTYYSANYQWYGSAPWAGRVTAIATDPSSADVAYVGGAAGGVWKTSDGGMTWTPVFDQEAPAIAIGSIAVDPNATSTVYVGTGEANFCCDSYFGTGVYKSTQGGAAGTWQKLNGSVLDQCHVSDIVVKPGDSNIVLVAVHGSGKYNSSANCLQGIYRSTNATDATPIFARVTSRCRPTDLAVDPNNPNVMYGGFVRVASDATDCGVYKSIDSGLNWAQAATNLPTGPGVVRVAVAPSDSTRVYAAISDCLPGACIGGEHLLGGKLWTGTTAANSTSITWTAAGIPAATDFCDIGSGGQCAYDLALAVSPSNASTFYAAGVKLFKYVGGEAVAPPAVGFCDPPCVLNSSDIHVDFHALAFDKDGRLWIGNDGGVYRTSDGVTFTNLNKDLNVIQFYPGTSGSVVGPFLGGAQDDGVSRFTGDKGWGGELGADGAFTAVDPTNPNVLFGSTQNLDIWKSTDGGKTVSPATNGISSTDKRQFIAPFVMDPSNPQVMYAGTERVWKTTNQVTTAWTAVSPFFETDTTNDFGSKIVAIAVAPSSSSTVYVGTSGSSTTGTTAQVHVTTDGGVNWPDRTSAPLPNRAVTDIAVNDQAQKAGEAYVTYSGFGSGHVFKTTDFGVNWSDITGDLPNTPVNAIALDTRTSPVTIYVGTDVGVFWSAGGSTWIDANTGLPNTVVMDLVLDKQADQIIAATHGRGAWTADVVPPAAPGGKIVFNSDRDGDYEIYAESANGTGLTKLTDNTAADFDPVYSPDRTKIAFSTDRDGNYEIYTMNADGTNPVRLTNSSGIDEFPTWSGNGAQIAFDSNRDGDYEIFKMNANGTGVTQLTSNTFADGHPSWSPTAAEIAFHSNRDGDYEIFKMNADGSGQTQLTTNAQGDGEATFSSSGTKIAFDSSRDGDVEIFTMNADGTSQTQLTTNTAADEYPAWAPDDSQITFDSDRDGNRNVFKIPAAGGSAVRLTSDLNTDSEPHWQPATSTATLPGAPTGVSATAGNGSANVGWTPPASDGGSGITNYVVTPYIGASAQTTTTVGNVTSSNVTGLTNGTTYTFKVAATNGVGTGPQSSASNAVTPSAAAHTAYDYDGDGKADVAVFRGSEGRWYSRRSSDSGLTLTTFGLSSDVPVPADYDGDGKTDLAVFRPSEGRWYIQRSSDSALVLVNFGTSTDVPVPADFDGDGKADVAVFRGSEGRWYVRRSSDSGLSLIDFGLSTDVLVPADYDGDGKADAAVFRASEGRWYVKRTSDSVVSLTNFGLSTDVPVPADYDGDGKADVAVFRPSEGRWYVSPSGGGGLSLTSWGASSDRVEPADYDGDGKTDLTVFRPSEGRWYVRKSSDATLSFTNFGLSTDIQLSLPYALRKVFYP